MDVDKMHNVGDTRVDWVTTRVKYLEAEAFLYGALCWGRMSGVHDMVMVKRHVSTVNDPN